MNIIDEKLVLSYRNGYAKAIQDATEIVDQHLQNILKEYKDAGIEMAILLNEISKEIFNKTNV